MSPAGVTAGVAGGQAQAKTLVNSGITVCRCAKRHSKISVGSEQRRAFPSAE